LLGFLKEKNKKLLAEKIETVQDYGAAMASDFDYFQGYFFCEPSIVVGREIPSTKMQNLRLSAGDLQARYGFRPGGNPDQARSVIVIQIAALY
jgi:hypothetical protein